MDSLCSIIFFLLQCGINKKDVCKTTQCERAANMMMQNRNASKDRCQNYYAYTCENFRATNLLAMVQIQQNYMNEQMAGVLSVEDETALPAIKDAREMYKKCIEILSDRPTARIDCAEPVMDEFPRVLLYLLVTPEIRTERDKVQLMAGHIRSAFEEMIKNSWLSESAKTVVSSRIRDLRVIVGFTREMIELDNLLMPYKSTYKLFGYSCSYNAEFNVLFVPIAALTYPTTKLGLDVLNFAAIGFEIAREMYYAFGTQEVGSEFWWTLDMQAIFLKRAECFKEQYDQFTVRGTPIGDLTLVENMADNVAAQVALDAYDSYANDNEKKKRLVKFERYSQEKLFMMALANNWCENISEDAHAVSVLSGRAPAYARVNGMIMNSEYFGRLWNCGPQTPMNPNDKCNVFKKEILER